MTEYDVKKALTQRSGKVNQVSAASQQTNGIPNSVLADVFSGKRGATSEMMGRRQDLAPGLAAKMSQSFGMDFSAVQLYRSDAMAGTELHGMAQGNKVVLSSDVDLNTLEGQAVLGHELSHIRAQSMGIGSGNGLLNDSALEHQADSEGLLAARGMNISGERMGMTTGLGMAGMEGLTPVGGGLGASAAAPMQALKHKNGDVVRSMSGDTIQTVGPSANQQDIEEETEAEKWEKKKLQNQADFQAEKAKELKKIKKFGYKPEFEDDEFFRTCFDDCRVHVPHDQEAFAQAIAVQMYNYMNKKKNAEIKQAFMDNDDDYTLTDDQFKKFRSMVNIKKFNKVYGTSIPLTLDENEDD